MDVFSDDAVAAMVEAELARSPRATLQQLATRLGVDRHRLARSLRRSAGTTFRRLSRDAKLRYVRGVVGTAGTESIKAAAYGMGYRSPASLTRFVREHCGCTPTSLRSRHETIGVARRQRVEDDV